MRRSSSFSESGSRFGATRWSIVLAAGNWRTDASAHRALGELAALYWFPLYAYLRRKGSSAAQAEDLVQGFFAQLLEKDALAAVDRTKGKFRSFLLASLKNYMANEWDKGAAQKRGGGVKILTIDASEAEAQYVAEPVEEMTPERVFERRWAWALLDHVLEQLRADYQANGKAELFEGLKGSLTAGADAPDYANLGAKLGMTSATLQVAAHRLRRRYRELLRREIAETVSTPELVDEEIAYLLSCL